MNKRTFLAPALLLLPFLLLFCHDRDSRKAPGEEAEAPQGTAPRRAAPPPTEYLSIVAAGDNLYHDIFLTAFLKNGVYDYTSIYKEAKPYIEPADIAFINQETVFVEKNFTAHPLFGTPSAAGDALIDAGFDVINHATNHVMDRGEAGIRYTLSYWDSRPEVRYLGIYHSEEEIGKPVIIEKNNFKTGFLSYTFGTNGIPLPKGKEYLVSLIDEEKMAAAIDALRPQVDILAVSMHWGNEYETSPSREQKALARFLADHNVDLVIGHHPHVLQPVERLPRKDGKTMLCFYSLGNFISAQILPRGYVLLGGLMYVKFKRDTAGLGVADYGVVPMVTFYSEDVRVFKMYPLQDYTPELAARHWNKEWMEYKRQPPLTVEFFHTAAKKILGDAMMLRNPFAQD